MKISKLTSIVLINFIFFYSCYSADKINFDELTFSATPTDYMYKATCKLNGSWEKTGIVPYGNLDAPASSCIYNYAQGIFEGMKAYRTANNKIVLFRPLENAKRFQRGATRLGMPPIPEFFFIDAIKEVVLANINWIPPYKKGTLYIRPLLLGTGSLLTLMPAPSYTFIVFVTPVGDYFKGKIKSVDLLISDKYHRAHPGGTGDVKTTGNYGGNFIPLQEAKEKGYSEILYLDVNDRYIEEVGAANFFCIKDRILYTPELTGTILPGITRDSIMKIARSLGYEVKETKIDLNFVFAADEAFCCGTAAVISPIKSLTYKNKKVIYQENVGAITLELYENLTAIQSQEKEDKFGWTYDITPHNL
jgi:branched-chain amino acid aminotransferase